MSFRKPFQAQPVKLGPYWRAEQRRERRRQALRLAARMAIISTGVFIAGMMLTNWTTVSAMLPTHYPNCAWARLMGSAPISRGSPGYRSQLDADDDGVACEDFQQE